MRICRLIAALCCCALFHPAAQATVNPARLGAAYDATQSNISFKVYSSRATRIEVYLYSAASGAAEKTHLALAKGSDNVWSLTVPVSTLNSVGITAPVYYGYRAWGPNWPFNAAWTKGSAAGFESDVDAAGNRFNPNKLLTDPYAR